MTSTGRAIHGEASSGFRYRQLNFPGLDSAKSLPSSARAGRTFLSPRFDQLTTAAEVIGDFLAAAAGVIGAYTIYRVLGLGKAVLYPFPFDMGGISIRITLCYHARSRGRLSTRLGHAANH